MNIVQFKTVVLHAEKTLLKDYLSGVMVEDKNRPTFEVHKNPEKVYEK